MGFGDVGFEVLVRDFCALVHADPLALGEIGGLSVPLVGVVLRRGYGLGAQAMLGGSTHRPHLTVAWPDAHLGPMGLEGAVRLSMAGELAQLPETAGEQRVAALTEE